MSEELELEDHGTTVLAISVEEGIVFAADRKTSRGFLIASKDSQKIRKINKRAIFTRVGSVADSQDIEKHLRRESKTYRLRRGRQMSVETLAEVGSNKVRDGRYRTAPIIGGVDEEGSHIYTLDSAGSILYENQFTSSGSGSKVAYGTLESNYSMDMDVENARSLAIDSISAATERDNMTGCGITIGSVTEDDGVRIDSYSRITDAT